MTSTYATAPWAAVSALADRLVSSWGAWSPALTAGGERVAFVSDREGAPQLWIQDVPAAGSDVPPARCVASVPGPVLAVGWSPDDRYVSCSVATGGGVRTEVWVVRPDGTDARRVAGGDVHAVLGPWARTGHELVATVFPDEPERPHECLRIDAETGRREVVARGKLLTMLDLADDGRFALLRAGTRGAQYCCLVDRRADVDFPLLPYPETGATEVALLRPSPSPPSSAPSESSEVWSRSGPDVDGAAELTAYLVTDAGRARRELVAVGIWDGGRRSAAGSMAARDDAELEFADADDAGTRLLLVWNVSGSSEIELLDTATGDRRRLDGLPGEVVADAVLARDGSCVVVSVESPTRPRQLWRVDCATSRWSPVTASGLIGDDALTAPQLLHLEAHDGLALSGWFYPATDGAGPAVPGLISLHGGPEAQERPVFDPLHQTLAAAGVSVFAPNIRGSSGFGKSFVHADDRWGRFDAIDDVADCAHHLIRAGLVDPARLAVGGRSYGGYATLFALVRHRGLFAAGIDVCGMSDLRTFYRDTEPWIAAAAVTKYGDPVRDAVLLADASPLNRAAAIEVPVLVVHGELDTNVPLGESRQLVARLTELGRPVEFLQLPGEGHEFRAATSVLRQLQAMIDFVRRRL